MLGTASLTRAQFISLALIMVASGCGLMVVGTASHALRIQSRNAVLTMSAVRVAASLQSVGETPGSLQWSEAATSALQNAEIDPGITALEVMMPAPDSPSRWRLVAALPERPEALLPISDPQVQRALAATGMSLAAGKGMATGKGTSDISGRYEPALWFDPAGNQWCSIVIPVRDQKNNYLALVEARAPAQVPVGAEVGWAISILALGATLAVSISLLAVRRSRTATADFNDRLNDVHRHGDDTVCDRVERGRDLGPLVGPPQLASAESTARRLRQQREVTELRAQVARFQGADRTKTTLLVALCRSLRQSVDSLRASAQLLAQTRIDRTQRDYVETVQASCGDLLTRIGDVLDFALLEAECISLEQRPLRPRLVLEEALVIVAERCVQLPIELAWHADPAVPERVIGDVSRVRQVLVNLISLAASTAEEGTVVVHVVPEVNSQLTFRISLMGVTLTADRIRLLLEGAISSDSSSDRLQGEGLGLVLGKRLAQAMGGSLGIERADGEDIELVCTLRVMTEDVVPDQPLVQRLVVVAHERPATRRMLTSILERAGATVVEVSNHRELHACLAAGPQPSAVVVGTRVVSAMDAEDDAVEIIAGVQSLAVNWPLVLVVDPVHRGLTPEMRSAGALGLIAMPVRQQALLATVSDAVSGVNRESSLHHAMVSGQKLARVLVVEDNEVNRLVLVRMLESQGIQPELADQGQQALDHVRAASAAHDPYVLIFMDCMMPGMDGLTATREIRALEETESHVWIIAVTANALANDRTKCITAGMNDYLSKPITPISLREALGRWRHAAGLPRMYPVRFSDPIGNVEVRRNQESSVSRLKLKATRPAAVLQQRQQVQEGHLHEQPQLVPESSTMLSHERSSPSDTRGEVDFSGLKMLAKLAGSTALSEVVACFLKESEKMLNDVHAAAMAGDLVRLRAAAHKMKGSCGTVGLLAAQAHLASVEVAAKDSDLATARQHVDTLPSVFAAGMAQLRSFRDGV